MMIYVILSAVAITALSAYVLYARFMIKKILKIHNQTIDKHNDMLSSLTSDIVARFGAMNERISSVEDFEAMLKQELVQEKHKDYWVSVMDYNPFTAKEKDK